MATHSLTTVQSSIRVLRTISNEKFHDFQPPTYPPRSILAYTRSRSRPSRASGRRDRAGRGCGAAAETESRSMNRRGAQAASPAEYTGRHSEPLKEGSCREKKRSRAGAEQATRLRAGALKAPDLLFRSRSRIAPTRRRRRPRTPRLNRGRQVAGPPPCPSAVARAPHRR